MSPERIYLRHYNDNQTSPIDPHTLRLWRLGDGDIEYVRADPACPTPSLEAIDILDLAKALKSRMDSKRIETYGFAGFAATIKPEMFEAPTPSLAAAPEVDPETCTHQNTELVCLDCCPSPAAHNPDQSWSADREAGPVGINQDLWRSLYDLCRIVRSTPGESICSALTAYLAGSFDDFGLKVNLAFKTSASPSEGKEKGKEEGL